MADKKILVSITTTKNSDWREKIEETKRYNIQEVALFPTCFGVESRKELYALLEDTPIKNIPHVHIRNDIEVWEMEFLAEKYHTKLFNIHPVATRPLVNDISRFYDRIYIENVEKYLDERDIHGFAGLCIDFSHWESFNLCKGGEYAPDTDPMYRFIKEYPIGCCHISAVRSLPSKDADVHNRHRFSFHMMECVEDLSYIKKYLDYLPETISIELANPLAEQMRAKKYLENLINRIN